MKASPVYLPVLRAKAAEFKALSDYQENPHRLVNVLPLFEPVPAQFLPSEDKPKPDVNDQLSSLVNRVFDSWGVTKPFLIDLRLLPKDLCTNDGQLVYAYIQNIAVPRGLSLRFVVPLWGELRPDHQQELVRITGSASDVSVGIRLAARRWIKATSVPQVDETLDRYRVTPSEVDLIVDYGKYDDSPSVSVASLLESMPYVDEWRTLVLLGGSFPVDLSDMTKNAMHRVPRREWTYWREEIAGLPRGLRGPAYGDYTIQHPVIRQDIDQHPPSQSIRYTHESEWIVMRGQKVEKGQKSQYPAQAVLLSQLPEFCGNDFSAGDRRVSETASEYSETGKVEHPGNSTTWLTVGINHHLVYVVNQIAEVRAA